MSKASVKMLKINRQGSRKTENPNESRFIF
jgi:hypothetical protein